MAGKCLACGNSVQCAPGGAGTSLRTVSSAPNTAKPGRAERGGEGVAGQGRGDDVEGLAAGAACAGRAVPAGDRGLGRLLDRGWGGGGVALFWGLWHTRPFLRGLWHPCPAGRPGAFGGWGTHAPLDGGGGTRAPSETRAPGQGTATCPEEPLEKGRAADRLRGLEAAVRPEDRADPGMAPFATAEGAQWNVIRAGRILVAAGALEEDLLNRFSTDLQGAIQARSRILLNWIADEAWCTAAATSRRPAARRRRLAPATGDTGRAPRAGTPGAQRPRASVIAHRDAPALADGPGVFAPLACVLPDIDGAQFALAGLSTAGGESCLHVVGQGMAPLADRYAWNWTPGFSWWLRDSTGNWHVAAAGEPHRSAMTSRRSGCG
jgi:hypothetical protein